MTENTYLKRDCKSAILSINEHMGGDLYKIHNTASHSSIFFLLIQGSQKSK